MKLSDIKLLDLKAYVLDNKEQIPSHIYDELVTGVSEIMSHRFEEFTNGAKDNPADFAWKVGWLWCLMGEDLAAAGHTLYLGVDESGSNVVVLQTKGGNTVTEPFVIGSLCIVDLLNLIVSMANRIDKS